ncbi:hypothetical protein ACIRBX_14415 [Kitasatospora sp. NPDC096147]|uniref:hypothetical protein n=1 Tax=Kitasatospora sp. NPDC096147 TaxID=3364093 RepID=UPI003811E001
MTDARSDQLDTAVRAGDRAPMFPSRRSGNAPGMDINDLAVQTQLAGAGGSALWLILAGVLIVIVILLGFVLGQRRKDREPPPSGLHRRGDRH